MARTRTTTEVEEITEEERVYPDHPLFPRDEGDKSFDVTWILVSRIEEGVQKYGPNVPAAELLTEQDVSTRWGGGHYILIARAQSTTYEGTPGRFTKHRRVHLPGISKPLSPDPTPQEQRIAAPGAPKENGSAVLGGDPMSFFGMMMQMQQQSLERERQASERAQQQSNQQMQMLMAMMQGSKSDAQAMTQTMLQMASQSQQSMMGFVTAMMAQRGGGPEDMAKYAEIFKLLGVGGAAKPAENGATSESIGAMLENAADFVQGLAVLKGGAPPPQVPQDASTVPTGGASALLRGMGR